MVVPHSLQGNRLLGSLADAEAGLLAKHFELVTLRLGEMLYEPGIQLRHAYFPTSAIVSLHYVTESGAACETAGVGNEGFVGVSLFTGGNTMLGSAIVHTSGDAYRLPGQMMIKLCEPRGAMHRMLLGYFPVLITQIAQNAVCNRHHSIDQQLARWLLSTLDRIPSGELALTQELIAGVLGVRREGITEAAGELQRAGYIRYRRGHLSVLDRTGLEHRACECYGVVKQEMRRLGASPRP